MSGSDDRQQAFVFDLGACTGCEACGVACAVENDLAWGESWRQVVSFNPRHLPAAPSFHLSLACNHCRDAPCMHHCPALAYTKDAATGAVLLDPERCIGCKYCSWACPYDAPRYEPEAGVMGKCTFCHHRLVEGRQPACVTACPTGALGFGALSESSGVERVEGFPDAECGPAIRFTPLVPRRGPEVFGAPGDPSRVAAPALPRSKITLRSEWPLLAFTLLAATLVALVAAAAVGRLRLSAAAFLPPAAVSLALASLHLGKKLRAWRAVLNLRRSWLSREIFSYSAFLGLATLWLLAAPAIPMLGLVAALVGFAALFAIDRVYDVVPRPTVAGLHSAEVLLTGLLLTALLAAPPVVAIPLASLKLGLYVERHRRRAQEPRLPSGWAVLRLGAGFALPLALVLVEPSRWRLWALAGSALGELVDRVEFYRELAVPSPRRQVVLDLLALVRGGAS